MLDDVASDDPLEPRVRFGLSSGEATLADLCATDSLLGSWLEDEVRFVSGADGKLAAAYLLGSVAWTVSQALAHLHLDGLTARGLRPEDVGLSRRQVPWEQDGARGVATIYDVALGKGVNWHDATAPRDLGRCIESLHMPLVDRLAFTSRLSRGALWRLVGDSLSAALLHHGKRRGAPERGMAVARAILDDPASPLRSRQTGFVRIEIPEIRLPSGAPLSEWFRARGGCCRYYTSEGGDYCTTCVLRDPAGRDARLADYLRRTHAA